MQPMKATDPWKRIKELETRLDRLITETRSSMRALGATTFAGDLTVAEGGNIDIKGGGQIRIYDEADTLAMLLRRGIIRLYNGLSDDSYPGQIQVDQTAGKNIMRIFPPSTGGNGLENSITVRGRAADQTGYVWVYTDGSTQINADQGVNLTAGGTVWLTGASINLQTGGNLRLYELPTSSSSANVRLLEGGDPRIAWVTSSLRYKQDVEDAAIDPADVLKLRPRTWRDRGEVEADPSTTHRNLGFIAEEVAEIDSLRPLLVNNDEDGAPNTLNYDRFAAAQQSVLVDQQAQIEALKAENAALRDRLAVIEAHLDITLED